MTNHVRTLLLNDIAGRVAPTYPGEEYVPADFMRRDLTTDAAEAIRRLFGSAPDRAYINYRLRQYLVTAHASQIGDHLTFEDPRVTYWPALDPMQRWASFGTAGVVTRSGSESGLMVFGTPEPNDADGRCLVEWNITYDDSGLTISHTSPFFEEFLTPSFTGGLSEIVALPGSALTIRLRQNLFGQWTLTELARPGGDVSSKFLQMQELPGHIIELMFPQKADEPIASQRRAWFDSPFMPDRLAAYLLGASRLVAASPIEA
jgi:hypothetical protein